MMARRRQMCAAESAGLPAPDLPRITLSYPASRCPVCGHQIRWYENIPVLSWLCLGGKCSGCKSPISWRYPAVEVFTGLAFATVHLMTPSLAWEVPCLLVVSVLIAWAGTEKPETA